MSKACRTRSCGKLHKTAELVCKPAKRSESLMNEKGRLRKEKSEKRKKEIIASMERNNLIKALESLSGYCVMALTE